MSVLDTPATPEANNARTAAVHLKQQARMTFQQLVTAFNHGATQFWSNQKATPQEIAAALGTDGRELFQLHAKIGALLAEIKPESIAPGAAVIGTVTYADDGKVTVVPKQQPLP